MVALFVQGNEFSLYMLFTSNFILNKCRSINSFSVYPYIHTMTNNRRDEDQLAAFTFPDIDPNELPEVSSGINTVPSPWSSLL